MRFVYVKLLSSASRGNNQLFLYNSLSSKVRCFSFLFSRLDLKGRFRHLMRISPTPLSNIPLVSRKISFRSKFSNPLSVMSYEFSSPAPALRSSYLGLISPDSVRTRESCQPKSHRHDLLEKRAHIFGCVVPRKPTLSDYLFQRKSRLCASFEAFLTPLEPSGRKSPRKDSDGVVSSIMGSSVKPTNKILLHVAGATCLRARKP